jgi:uncharacterized repeat protein (TIGR03803 family)
MTAPVQWGSVFGPLAFPLRRLSVLLVLAATTAGARAGPVFPPTFSPAAGAYTSTQTVAISTTTSGASVVYTTDGSTPAEVGGSVTNGTLLSNGGTVSISATTRLKALAFEAGFTDSLITSGLYTIGPPAPSLNVICDLTPINSGVGSPSSGGLVQGSDGNYYGTTGNGGSNNQGTAFKMTPAGVVTTLISFDGANGSMPSATLAQGNDGNFYGTTAGGGAFGQGVVFQLVVLQAAAPAFSLAAGTYPGAQTVTITSATSGVSFAYTTDGSTPTEVGGVVTNGSLLSNGGSIPITTTTTLKIIAFGNGYADSAVATAVYTISAPIPTVPQFQISNGYRLPVNRR